MCMSTYTIAELVLGSWLAPPPDVDTLIDNPPDWSDSPHDDAPLPALELWQLDDEGLVAQARWASQVADAARGEWLRVLAECERRQATQTVAGLSTDSWLAAGTTHAARSARAEVRLATQLAGLPAVAGALASGRVSAEQADVICRGLARVVDLDPVQRHEVAVQLVELASEFGPTALRRLVDHAVEVVCPEVAEEADRQALTRQEQRAFRDRFVAFRRDPDGGVLLSGKLPVVEADLVMSHLAALADHQRAVDAVSGVELSRGQALADALVLAVGHHADCAGGPVRGGDATRVVVTIDHARLAAALGAGLLVNADEQVTAGQIRRLACTAGLLPVVLGGDSLPLDVGREQRLFTPAQRAALAVRDGGCAFPGCDRTPSDCHTHHIVPWGAGGPTDLANGVLVCPHHHHVVEPDPRKPPEQNWRIDLDARGAPVFTSPVNRSGQRITRQHHRYRT